MKKYFLLFMVMMMILGLAYSMGERVVMTIAGTSNYVPINRVVTDEDKIAFTINLSTSETQIDDILQTLKKSNTKVTFMLTQEIITKNPEIVRKIYLNGHQIGYLAFENLEIEKLSLKEATEHLQAISDHLEGNIGEKLMVIRPFNNYNDTIMVACKNLRIKCIQENVRSNDEKTIGLNDIVQRVLYISERGSIVNFSVDGKYTNQAIAIIIQSFNEQGIKVVPVSEILYTDNYNISSNGEQIKRGD